MSSANSARILFTAGTCHGVELGAGDIPRLQRFFELNPEYFVAVCGHPTKAGEADREVHGTPPDGWPFTRKWLVGCVDEAGSLVGMADIVADLLAPTVWHLGLFLVATRLHGSGVAHAFYQQLEGWALALGARWLRLGVVQGNTRAERFWERCAFLEVRQRRNVAMGERVNTLRVMVKPLADGALSDYLELVARDRPEAG